MQSLPPHRQFLTSLLNSISDIPLHPVNDDTSLPSAARQSPTSSSSPLRAIQVSHRPLLLTLHVLFPNLLLPALDLLDRGLITRLWRNDTAQARGDEDINTVKDKGTAIASGPNSIFLVRSIATTMSRRGRDHTLSSRRYIVHLGAWNCSCASFTFDAFPNHPTSAPGQDITSQSETDWSFGSLSLDGLGASAGDVPCCKHLLACLLAEKWSGMLGQYIDDRGVTRDEMAGIMADI